MINHYFAWYDEIGSTEVILPLLVNYISKAHQVYQKPLMMSEYGADTIAGLHTVSIISYLYMWFILLLFLL